MMSGPCFTACNIIWVLLVPLALVAVAKDDDDAHATASTSYFVSNSVDASDKGLIYDLRARLASVKASCGQICETREGFNFKHGDGVFTKGRREQRKKRV